MENQEKLEEEREEKRRQEEEEREERGRREVEEKEARRQEREVRKLEMEAKLLKQKEAVSPATTEHELELARFGQGQDPVNNREDQAKTPNLPLFVDGKDDIDASLAAY